MDSCKNCVSFDATNNYCVYQQHKKNPKDSCKAYVNKKDKKEKERFQLADHYVPNIWDEWKRKALLKENAKNNWEV